MTERKPDRDEHGLPLCSEQCPKHDGKRCRELGFRPDRFCEPALIDEKDEAHLLLENVWGDLGNVVYNAEHGNQAETIEQSSALRVLVNAYFLRVEDTADSTQLSRTLERHEENAE